MTKTNRKVHTGLIYSSSKRTRGESMVGLLEKMKTQKEEWVTYLLLIVKAYICAFLFTHCIVQPVYVKGSSMSPTINEGTIGFSNILARHIQGIERFDIVLFKHDDEIWVKRVIGLSKETIQMKDNVLYINGEAMEQTFLPEYVHTEDFGPIYIEEDHVFVLGDHRSDSDDSRRIGGISKGQILSTDLYYVK